MLCYGVLFFWVIHIALGSIIVTDSEKSPSVIIVGAGAAGIAAASKLYQNGFKDVKIFEADGRIGGRIYSTLFHNQMVDMGGQWVHGEKGNIVFESAWPHGLLERGNFLDGQFELFDSSGKKMNQSVADDLKKFFFQTVDNLDQYAQRRNGPIGQHFLNEFEKYFKAHPYLKNDANGLLHLFDKIDMEEDGGDTWWDVSTRNVIQYIKSPGANQLNWKNRTYFTILDILMKRFPNPKEELPNMNNTILNSEVTLIYNNEKFDRVTVTTADGGIYSANHVIVTVSLGVLKEKHTKLFYPPLPSEKVKAINGMGFGNEAKIFLSFDKPWWKHKDPGFYFYWKDEDRAQIEKEPEKKWLLGLNRFSFVDHRPGLLYGWLSGNYSQEMELIPKEKVFNHIIEALQRFMGKHYNITKPTGMISKWNSKANFRGAYTYLLTNDILPSTLAQPIGKRKPRILFAGEATHSHFFSTVHGAIESGFREADRLIKLYPHLKNNKLSTN
ncbi:spermine oxidase-like isoform X2 [Leptopilina heterotoma]|uniref:spermine oxidase-like isoform X2 n=1 Tax=Leptopilina heterotoma TaxID=63436 RepID=UPI001CAA367A|nr:spermine oxidase-like isoform X2 [Leptopilina heterotoma]